MMAPDVRQALETFLDTEPQRGGHYHCVVQHPNHLAPVAMGVARDFLGDASRWHEFLEPLKRRYDRRQIVVRVTGTGVAYWPRRFDRAPVTS